MFDVGHYLHITIKWAGVVILNIYQFLQDVGDSQFALTVIQVRIEDLSLRRVNFAQLNFKFFHPVESLRTIFKHLTSKV